MRHKGERHIPDYSKKPKDPHAPKPERKTAPAPGAARSTQPKPQSTSAKSGRRGQ